MSAAAPAGKRAKSNDVRYWEIRTRTHASARQWTRRCRDPSSTLVSDADEQAWFADAILTRSAMEQ